MVAEIWIFNDAEGSSIWHKRVKRNVCGAQFTPVARGFVDKASSKEQIHWMFLAI